MTASIRTVCDAAFADLAQELASTRTHLERVPDDKLDFRPHPKSKSLGQLATHLAFAPRLTLAIAGQDELDMATSPKAPDTLPSRDAILALFDEAIRSVQPTMEALDDAALERPWTFRVGERVVLTLPRGAVLRRLGVSHLVHHRAQLGVYLRMCGVAVPSTYGPSADE